MEILWAVWGPTEETQERAIRYGQDKIMELLENGGRTEKDTLIKDVLRLKTEA